MFNLSANPIDSGALISRLQHEEAGGVVIFEGRVRCINQNRSVTRLEYEGAETLARNEFQKIADETAARYDLIDLHCVHRVGLLEIGDIAVWIGVLAKHRGPAFEACRYVIDELKKRLPIWKKEYYTDGDSGWINAP